MKILLTGATGFIGSHTARALLADGHEVHALVRPQSDRSRIADIQSSLPIVTGDFLDQNFRLTGTFDLCVHCAWYVEPGKYLDAPANHDYVTGSVRLAEALLAANCRRLLVTGTCFEYSFQHPRSLNESSSTGPKTLYAESKLQLLQLLQQQPLALTWARIFYQYGPAEHPQRLVPSIIRRLLRGETCPLTAGNQVRDFLHVADVGRALAAVVRHELTGVVNIGSGTPVNVRQIAETLGQILGRPDLLQFGAHPARPTDPDYVLADNSRLIREAHWQPKFTLDEGLLETAEWWKSQGPAVWV